ncbi:MAG: ABC transporter ATP-binding protein [Dehalococcoidales bacterium]|nr:ABC transporter ATP-binding protein [Dehalococcoidales bacterium]MDD3265125.1 ABC transporter ATP-binding protein [Dehalococcoidales bacterium]MDD5122880.1 ABC transporter ATP-binding protein [Dehalococcoidales bacterium]MDX9803837.1 ABC transporter ATP-binding protein [Dehalococcoidales bacterium]
MLHVEATHLVKKAGEAVLLKGVSLRINKGESFLLIGPTGAGKTTLLRLLGLLNSSFKGELSIFGVDVISNQGKQLEIRRKMAFVQQKPVAFSCSVFDNVAYPLKWRKIPREEITDRVGEVLDLVGMKEYSNRNAKTLSGGETQRVAIARALVTRPEILLLDEPTANLDPNSAGRIEEVLTKVVQEHKTTLIMSTHDLVQAQRLAEVVGVMIDGKLVQTGTPQEVFHAPQNSQIARFIGFKLAEQDFNRIV